MASRIAGITVEIGGDTTKLSKALEGVNKSIKTTQAGLKDVNKLLKLDPSNTEAVTQKQRMLKDAIEATKEKLTTLKTAAEQANQQLADGKITQEQYDALQREIVETEQNLKSLQEQAAVTNTTLAKIDAVGEKMQTVGSAVEGVGKKLLPVTAAVTGLGTAAVKTAADFDQEMSKVSAISGATGDDFDQLRAKAREMGAKTKFSASEAASAMEYMAMAGWKTGDMLDGIEGIMNLAAASGEDLATTSDIVTDALTAFGLSAADSGHFADILAAASSNANTNVSMMGETFKYCAPIAGALGFSAEDTAEAIGLMANSGIKASQAGTSLRSIMNNLAGEVTFAGKNIGEVTIATSNADGSMRSLNDILADCRVAFSGLTESEKAANAESLVGKNAMSGFLALMNSGEEDINKLRGAIENCDGSAESMAETMQDNLNGQLTILKSQLEELAISFGDLLMPTIRKIVSAVQGFVDKLNSMDDSTRETILKVAALAAAIGPLLIVLGKTISTVGTALRGFSSLAKGIRLLSTRVGGVTGLFGKLGAALGGISAPVMAVVAVIGTLVAAFMHLWNTNEEFRTAITSIWNGIVEKVRGFCDQLTQRLNALGFDFKDIVEVLKAVWDGFCQVLAPVFEGAFQVVSTVLGTVLDTLIGLFDVFSNLFQGNWSGAWEAVKSIFSGIWDGIESIFSTVLDTLKGVADVFLGWFGTDWNSVWENIKGFFEGIWTGISDFFSGILTGIQTTASNIWTGISDFFTGVWTGIKDFFEGIWNGIVSFFTGKTGDMDENAQSTFSGISDFLGGVLTGLQTVFSTVWDAISGVVSGVMDAISAVISTVMSVISGDWSTAWENIKSAVSTVWEDISGVISGAWEGISSFVSGAVETLGSGLSTAWTGIQTTASSAWDGIKGAISTAWDGIQSGVTSAVETVATGLSGAWEGIQSTASTAWEGIKSGISSAWEGISGFFGGIWDAIIGKTSDSTTQMKTDTSNAWSGVEVEAQTAWSGVSTSVSTACTGMAQSVTSQIDSIKASVSAAWSGIAVSLGHGDRAGVIINGALKEGENDVSVLRFTEPMAFKAGTPYTVFIDETTPKVGYGIYFYEVGTGNCLQVGGINRGFTPANTKIATAVFDNGGMFRAGIYSTNCEFENHELHLYVVEGEYTQRDFFGLSTVADVSGNVAEIASVRDEVRKNNLIVMKQVILKNEENEPLWTSTPVGALNLGATVLNGQLGPTAGTYAVQISSPFMLDKEKDYTLFLLDERKDLEYSVYLLDETTWKDVMENGATRAFNVIHSPCGLIPAHQTGKHQLRIWVQQDTVFDNRAIQVYLVEGRYSESELRTYLPAKEASAATKGLTGNLNALNRISDPLRRNNMIRTIDFQASASDGQVCATAVSSGVASGTVINGSLGPKQGRNTLYFGESIWLDRTKKYTLYVRSDESMPSCEVYLYGNSKSGCMQVDGLNKGFSVHGIIPVTFTPDESGYYRPGIYTSQDLNFPNCEMHLFVLEGVYAYDTVRGLVEFNDLNGSFTSLAAVHDNVRSKNLFRTINYGDSNPQTNAKIQMIADSDIDQASVKIVGNMGGTLALNSIRCTTLVPLTSGKTYTLLVREDEDCPALTVFLGDEVTYGSIQINGATVSVNTKNRHVYTFTADKDYSCRARVVCDTATTFDGQHIRVYLVEGAYTEQQMRSWAEYSELLQVKVDADQRLQVLSDREDARWISTHNGLENILTVSDRARMNNMVKTIDSVVRSNAGDVSATATALGVLDEAGIIVNGLMSSELNATILRISEPMHLEKGKAYTVHIVDDDPPAPYSMFFYRTTSSACLQQGGTNRGVSAIGGRFEQVIPDTTGDYQMGIYATGAVFSNHLIHAYMYEGQDWSADDFYAYPKSDTLAAVISEMAAVKDDVRKKNLVRMLGNKGFLDGTGVYRLNSIGMPDPAGIMLNGTFGTASTTTYTNISEVFHLEAGQSYTILVRDTDKTVDYNMTLVDKTTGAAVKQNGMGLAFNVQKSPFGTFAPDASMDVRLRINYRKEMTLEDHILHVYVVEGKLSQTDMLAFAQEKEEEPEEDIGFPYESYNLPLLKLTGSMKGISKENKVKLAYAYGELTGNCTLKWQGASSLAYDKKNFTITFDEKRTIVEKWGAQKKYCLKANYIDFSHCRNIVAAKLWGQAVRTRPKRNEKLYDLPNGGAIDGFPIMVAINDEYQGIYTLNIPKDKWMFGMTDGAKECILTAETHAKGTQFAEEAKVDKTDFEMEYVPDESNTQWVKDSVNTLIRAVMNFSGTTAADVESALSPYLDLDSTVDYFIITSMFALTDNLDKNYILMTFDGVKWAFSEYDLDTAFGNCWNGKVYYNPDTVTTLKGFAGSHKLMGILYNCYRAKIKSRYASLRKNVLSEGNVQTVVSNFLVDIPKGLLDHEVVLWPKIPGTNTNNMSQIINWYRLKCIAMDAEVNAL